MAQASFASPSQRNRVFKGDEANASRHVLAVRDVVRAEAGRQVGTVGYIRAEPRRSTISRAVRNSPSSCAISTLQRSTACGK